MALAEVARAHYVTQSTLARAAAAGLQGLWALLDPSAPAASWTSQRLLERMFVALSAYQVAAAASAQPYTAAVLADQGASASPVATIVPRALAGVASDGRDLESLLYQPLATALTALRGGQDTTTALQLGQTALGRIASTQVADAGRAAEQVAMAAEPAVTGWVRMLVPPACGRCAVLAGRFYRWNSGFLRHPRCDCRTVPAVDDTAEDLRTDPDAYFRSLPRTQQDLHFTAAGAEAIRAGSDIGQVVNARRGARGLSQPGRLTDDEQRMLRGGRARGRLDRVDLYGRQTSITTEGTVRGLAAARLPTGTPRLMPEAIFEIADGDRDQATALLQRFGYLT